jgi:ribonuclease HI
MNETRPDAALVEIVAYTDGACSGNPGPGGWGALLIARAGEQVLRTRELSGGEAYTTNNRMELMAAIAALEAMERPTTVTVITDSAYLRDGVTRWIHGWKANGWLTADRKPVKNAGLWQRLEAAAVRHKVSWAWVRGHAGDPGNERADELAREGLATVKAAATVAGAPARS